VSNFLDRFTDKVKCYACRGIFLRGQTLIVQNEKGKFRVCRDCFALYQEKKMNKDYQDAKDNVKLFNLKETDAYEIMKKKEKFLKDIKEGRI
jgi:ribosome-binding protein aMBF1 (putative translation factor)